LKFKKSSVILCTLLLFILIGGVSANDDKSLNSTLSVLSDDDSLQLADDYQAIVDDADLENNDSSTDIGDDNVVEKNVTEVESSRSGSGEILSASSDENVLGANLPSYFNGGTYNLATADYYSTSEDGVTIYGKTTLNGDLNHFVSGDGKNRIFDVRYGADVTFNNMVFKEGYKLNTGSSEGGGAAVIVRAKSDSTTRAIFNNCIFELNKANTKGGAIYSESGSAVLIFNNCTFRDNGIVLAGRVPSSAHRGGAITTQDGNTLNITNCTFTGNSVEYSYAGALYIYGTNTIIKNSNFTNNNAKDVSSSGFGGAIVFDGYRHNDKYLIIDSCNFIGNEASAYGAIYATSDTSSNIKYHSYVNITNTNFTGNVARSRYGGAIGLNSVKDVIVDNCNFTGNHAENASALLISPNALNPVIKNSVFNNNYANFGSAVYSNVNNIKLIENCNFTGNYANYYGALYFGYAVDGLQIISCNFNDNYLISGSGAAIYFNPNMAGSCKNVTIENSNFTNNSVPVYGGAIFGAYAPITLHDSIFENNSAAISGGAVYVLGSNTKIYNNTFKSNKATPNYNTITNDGAGAIWITATNVLVDNNKFINNTATNWAGAVLIVDSKGTVVSNCEFINNSAVNGGAIDVYSTEIIKIQNSKFINNSATNQGGAVWFSSSQGSISDSQFINNSAVEGGAIYLPSSGVELLRLTFNNNNATRGGAIYNNGASGNVLENSTFTSNTAVDGGGVYSTKSNSFILLNDTFSKNIAIHNGGAAYIIINGKAYSDYNLFSGLAEYDDSTGRETIPANNANQYIIFSSLFEENVDYLMNVTSMVEGLTAVVTVNVPKDAKGYMKIIVFSNVTGATINGAVLTGGVRVGGTLVGNEYQGATIVNATLVNADIFKSRNVDGNIENMTRVSGNMSGVTIINCTVTSGNINGYHLSNGVITEGKFDKMLTNTSKVINGSFILNVPIANETIVNLETGEFDISPAAAGKVILTLPRMAFGYYNVTAILDNEEFLYKENQTSFIIENPMGDFTILQTLINQALLRGEHELNLTRSYVYTENLDHGHMYINETFRINGNGRTLDAEGFCRIFVVNGEKVVLDKIIFNNGINLTSDGGAIYLNASHAIISNSEFSDNSAANGGAVFVSNNAVNSTITKTNFRNNNVSSKGGAISWNANDGTIDDVSFKDNYAVSGGGLFIGNGANDLKIFNSSFVLNLANENGGAIDCNGSRMALKNTEFISNYANFGAALCREVNSIGGFGTDNVFISNNAETAGAALAWINASSIVIDRYTFIDNTAGMNGGAIYVGEGSGNCEILNSIFIGNNVTNETTGFGGAIEWNAKQGLVSNSSFTNNNAFNGGAIYVGTSSGNINILKSNFTQNNAFHVGGAINLAASSVSINESRFIDNSALSGGAVYVGGENGLDKIHKSVFIDNYALDGSGGAIDCVASACQITYSNLTANYATYGGAIFLGGNSSDSLIDHVIFDTNYATLNGGAINWNSTGGALTNTLFIYNYAGQYGAALCRGENATKGYGYNNTFQENHADIAGAALAWMGSDEISITNYTFIDNTADVSGGAIYVSPDANGCKVIDSKFYGNNVTNNISGQGGAIDWMGADGSVIDSIFTNNNAFNGGAIYVGSTTGSTNISNSNFTRNNAFNDGGAINLIASSVTLNLTNFIDNTAKNNAGALHVGGNAKANYVYNSAFTGNNATSGYGGAINWVASAGHIIDTNFTRNYAKFGGGVYLNGKSSNSSIVRVIFKENNATINGGAIDWNASGGNLTNTSFISNYAGEYGAALCRESNATMGFGINNIFEKNHAGIAGAALAWMSSVGIKITNYTFTENTANQYGGAIYISPTSHNCTIIDSRFDKNHIINQTGGHGGAIYSEAENTTAINSNFTENSAFYGGAIFIGSDSGRTKIEDSLFKLNTANENGGAIYLRSSASNITGTKFVLNSANSGGAIFVGGEGDINLIYNSEFNQNSAVNYGGAINWIASRGIITYTNFTKNSAGYGGALYLGGTSSESIISHDRFFNNTAAAYGGAIDCNSSKMNLTYTVFEYNEAAYGAALCREGYSTGGFGEYVNFTNNHAYKSGAALGWLNASSIKINHYIFINNRADESGGAIYVGAGSDNCTILNSQFSENNVISGRGGDIDFIGINGTVINNTFKNSVSSHGASIYVGESSENIYIENSVFNMTRSLGYGGAISLFSHNTTIKNVNFSDTISIYDGGAIFAVGVENSSFVKIIIKEGNVAGYSNQGFITGDGGGFYLKNCENINITDSQFDTNYVRGNGGSISLINSNCTKLYNLTFYGDTAGDNGGSISAIDADNLTIELVKFEFVGSSYGGGAIYLENVNASIKNAKFNDTKAAWGYGGAIYVYGNVNITNATFDDFDARKHEGSAILFVGGNSTLENSTFKGEDPITILSDATVRLTRNNVTESSEGVFAVFNEGTLYLEKNDFDNIILNGGIIKTQTYTYVLDNTTHNATFNENFTVWAKIVDDTFNNVIVSVDSFYFDENVTGSHIHAPYDEQQNNTAIFKPTQTGIYLVNASDAHLEKNKVYYGLLNVKSSTQMDINVTQSEDCERVTITAKINPAYGIATGNVTFKVDGEVVGIGEIMGGIARITVENLKAGSFTFTGVYDGDDTHFGCENQTVDYVSPRQSWIVIEVLNIFYGQMALVNVTTNGNGSVIIVMNNNYTQRVVKNGKVLLNVSGLNPGNYTFDALYIGDEYYRVSFNETTFTVYKLNTSVAANPTTPIISSDNEIINVSVNENATGFIKILINGTPYYMQLDHGNATFNISGLAPGDYENIRVEYLGDNYFDANSTNITFRVLDKYPAYVIINAVGTVEIEGKLVFTITTNSTGNVTVRINGGKPLTPADGKYTFDADSVGVYNITAEVAENDLYYYAANSTTFEVVKHNAVIESVTIPENAVTLGKNATITVKMANVTSGKLIINVDEYNYTVNIKDKMASLTLSMLPEGNHTVKVYYLGDEKYYPVSNTSVGRFEVISKNRTVITIDAPETVEMEHTIEFTVTTNTTAPLVVKVNGQNATSLGNGRYSFANLTYAGIYTITVTSAETETHYEGANSTTFEGLKHNSTINVTAEPIIVGQTAVIHVNVTDGASGYALVTVNNETFAVKLNHGTGSVSVSGLLNRTYTIDVEYVGDDRFYQSNNSGVVEVFKVQSNITVKVENITIGEKAIIELSLPRDATGNVTVTVNRQNHTVFVGGGRGVLVLSDLKVGNYTVNVTYNGDSKYASSKNATEFVVKPHELTPSDIMVDDLGNGTVRVTISGNASGTANITIDGEWVVVPVTNGVAIADLVELTNVTPGRYEITVDYSGDENHTNATANKNVTIPKLLTPISIEVADIVKVGDVAVITVNVPAGATGNITLDIRGNVYSEKIEEGKAVFSIADLKVGFKTVVAEYVGDNNFTANYTIGNFTVEKRSSSVNITVNPIYVGQNALVTVNVTKNATGVVVIEVDGETYAVTLTNGTGSVYILNLENRTYEINATYVGDDNYLESNNTGVIEVFKVNSTVSVKVENLTIGQRAIIEISVPLDATGNVTVVVDNVTYNVSVGGGKGVLIVPGLKVGNYTVNVTYIGNNKYKSSNNSTEFRIKPQNITASDIRVDDLGNGTVRVTISGNASGTANITIDGEWVVVPVENGVAVADLVELTNVTPGRYEITVDYSGDENHTNATAKENVTIPKLPTPMSIEVDDIVKVGDVAVITVNVPAGAKGNVTLDIRGQVYTAKISNGKAVFNITGLKVGFKTVVAEYVGDNNFTANYTIDNFTVEKRSSAVNITVNPIYVGQNALVTVNVTKNATGVVVIEINNETYAVTLVNGTGSVYILDLENRTYEINATYVGDDNFMENNSTGTVEVFKVNSTVSVKVENLTIGQRAIIEIAVPLDATGNVTVVVDNVTYNVSVGGGKGVLIVPGLKVGNYTVNVTYLGNNKYKSSINSTKFTISPVKTLASDIKVDDLGNGTIRVTISGNASGTANITIDGEWVVVPVENGVAVADLVELTNVTPGRYDVKVDYSGDENHTNATANVNVTIPKYATPMTIEVDDIVKVGDVAVITVHVPANATGNITLDIRGNVYSEKIENGTAVFNITGLKVGFKTVVAEYVGDNNYTANYTIGNFTVEKRSSSVNITVNPIYVGQNALVTVNVTKNATGVVVIEVDGETYAVTLTNGTGSVYILDLENRTYEVNATYIGDDNYLESNNTAFIEVNKVESNITVKVDNITLGQRAIIEISVPKDATGNVTVTVGTQKYNVTIGGGKGVLIIPNLKVGQYSVSVTYVGDRKYLGNDNSTSFTVKPANTTTDGLTVVDLANGTVIVYVPQNATGNVSLTIINQTVVENITGGAAVFNLIESTNVTPGTYDINVRYNGDENHTAIEVNSTAVIPKYATPISIEVDDIVKVGDVAVITVRVPANASGNITLDIRGNVYSEKIENGTAVFNIAGLKVGFKTVVAEYIGDNNFTANYTIGNFTVEKRSSSVNITVNPIYVGQNALVTVNVTRNATGVVVIEVDDETYAVTLVNGTGSVYILDLENRTYEITATYVGDDNFMESNNTGVIEVFKVNSTVSVSVENLTIGQRAIIEIAVPLDATGNVTVVVDNVTYNVSVGGGKGVLIVPGLKVGNYTVNVTYLGDNKYKSNISSTKFTISPVKTLASDIKVDDLGNGTIRVTISGNASGTANITIAGEWVVVPVTNGVAVADLVELTNVTPGRYDVKVDYSGDENHTNATANVNVTIPKYATPISIEVDDIVKVGDVAVITVHVPANATGNITLDIRGNVYSEKIENGTAVFNIPDLKVGFKTVVAEYAGDNNFTANYTLGNFTVEKRFSSVNITVDPIYVGQNALVTVNVTENATGVVVIEVGNETYAVTLVNGTGSVYILNLENRTYTVTATYVGDDNFMESNNTGVIEVFKVNSTVSVKVENLTIGQRAIIEISVPLDATGNVTVVVDNVTYNVSVGGGRGVLIVPGLKVGNYTVNVTYLGDSKYKSSSNSTKFSISPVKTLASDIKVDDLGNGTIRVTISGNASGTANITIAGEWVVVDVTNGVAVADLVELTNVTPGRYDVKVDYSGDENHTNATANVNVTIPKYATPITIEVDDIVKVGDAVVITVKVPANATGNITLDIRGNVYSEKIDGGKAVFSIRDLKVGFKTVVAEYIGDNNFTANYTIGNFTVVKRNSTVNITVSPVSVGENALVTVNVTENATGVVVIEVGNETYAVTLVNGTGSVYLLNLENRTYTITATYIGDDRFLESNNTASLNVVKVNSTVSVKVENLTIGQRAIIEISVPRDATGNVTVVVDNVTYNVSVGGGRGVLIVPGLKVGNYTVNVTYLGDNKYKSSINSTKFNIKPVNTVESGMRVDDLGNGTIKVTISGNATGEVNITIGGEWVVVPVTDGVAVADLVELTNVTPGTYEVTVDYSGDENHTNATAELNVTIPRLSAPISIDVSDIKVGDIAVITVTVPGDAKGNIILDINGATLTEPIINGNATFNVGNLTYGVKTVIAEFAGDNNYTDNYTVGNFTVSKRESFITITTTPVSVGESSTITVNVPQNATGIVVIEIDGFKYAIDINNGTGSVNVTMIHDGPNGVKADYIGDDQYFGSHNESDVNVFKLESQITVTAGNITVGDKVIIELNLTKEATGNVTVNVSGEIYTVFVGGGKGVLVIPNMKVGTYTVNVTYNGDRTYRFNSNSTVFTVSPVNITSSSIRVDDLGDGTVLVTISGNASGTANITIDGEWVVVPVTDGVAVADLVELTNVTPGTYEVTVDYSGDENHTNATAELNVTIPRLHAPISIDVSDIKVGDVAVITVTVPGDAKGNITLNINGKSLSEAIVKGNATFRVYNLTEGVKTVTAEFAGDNNYTANYAVGNFTVSKRVSFLNITASAIEVGQTTTITVTVPENATGTVTVEINGNKYSVDVNRGTGSVDVTIKTNATFTINATYNGDGQYYGSSNTATVTVSKVPSTVNVTAENITVGDKAVIEISVPDDVNGNVTVTVNKENYTVIIAGGKGILVVEGLKVGNYTVNVTYNANSRYMENRNSTEFTVKPLNTTEDDVVIEDLGNGTVEVRVPANATGNVTVIINNETVVVNVTNGTAVINLTNLTNATPGEYNITVIYSGDDNHTAVELNRTVIIPKHMTPIDVSVHNIHVGDTELITVTVPEGAGGNITIVIDGVTYSEEIIDGTANFNINNLSNGVKTVAVNYIGDKNFTDNSTLANFTVSKRTSYVNIIVTDTSVGQDLPITVKVPANATGYVVVEIDGQSYAVNVTDGEGKLTVKDLINGTYSIKATYIGDDQYLESNSTDTVTLSKVKSSVSVTADDITIGEKAVIEITVPGDATGTVTVTIDGEDYPVSVGGGKAILVLPDLKVKNYTVEVTYNGDNKYLTSNNTCKFTVKPVNTTASDVQIKDDGNGTIEVTVPGNATGNITIIIDNQTVVVNITNGTAVINLTNLTNATPGEHNITVIYSGDENNTGIEYNTTVTIPKLPSSVNAKAPTIREGDRAIIYIEIDREDATGTVLVDIDGVGYYGTVEKGKAQITVPGLTENNYTVAVKYLGDHNYTESSTTAKLIVEAPIEITVNATGNSSTIIIEVPGNGTGNITVLIDGEKQNFTIINGTVVVDLTNITPGEHNITIIYVDANGTESVVNTTITVPKWDASVKADAPTIREGDVAVVNIKVDPSKATGKVLIDIDGSGYYAVVNNGTAKVTVRGLTEGTYEVKVLYEGDRYFNEASNVTTLVVQAPIEININGSGNNSGIVIDLPENSTGNVTVIIDNTTYVVINNTNGTVVVPLENVTPGEHNVTIIYVDGNGTESVVNTTITVPKWDAGVKADAPTIREGDVAVISIKVDPSKATGRVLIDVDGTGYYAVIEKGTAKVEVRGLKEGTYEVKVLYEGDDYFNEASNVTTLVVQAPIEVNVNGSGNNSGIVIDLPENSTGNVTVIIDNTTYVVINNTNGTVVVPLENVTPGEHNVTIIYVDGNGTESVVNTTITVPKWDAGVKADAPAIREGDVATVTVKVDPAKATGVVLVDINGVGYYANVTDGTATITVPGLKEGTYDVKVRYSGDEYYDEASNSTKLVVQKAIEIDVGVGGNGSVVIVEVPGNATGNVTVIIDGKNHTAEVVNGTAVVDLGNTTPGEHNITVIYSGDDGNAPVEVNKTITVPKYAAPMSVEVSDIKVGETLNIVVSVPKGATGKVKVEIDGKTYYADIKDGKASFAIKNLMAGDKTVTASYDGDVFYLSNSTTDTFRVSKNACELDVSVEDVAYGDDAVIKVTLPKDATGYVIVNVDGVDYGINLTAGERSASIPGLGEGKHDVKATYLGDDKYLEAADDASFTVSREPANIKVTGKNTTDGMDVKVDLPKDATGNITVEIDGKTYTVPAKGGENTIHIPGLSNGNHTAKVTYSGDDKYANESVEKTFNVVKTTIPVIIVIDKTYERQATDYYAGERGGYIYGILMDENGNRLANKTVQVAVNGPVYDVVTDAQGRIPLQINLMNENIYTYALFFQGDSVYRASHIASSKLTIYKKKTTISASDKTFQKSVKVKIVKVTLKTVKNPYDGKTYLKSGKKITLKVDGKTYKAKINKKGVAKFKVKLTKKGKYTAKIKFAGDKTYENSSKSIKITVK